MKLRWFLIGGVVIFIALAGVKLYSPRFGTPSDQKVVALPPLQEGPPREATPSLNGEQPKETPTITERHDDLTFFKVLKEEGAPVGLETKKEVPPPSPVSSVKPVPSIPLPYTIQVAAFNDQIAARRLASRLSGKGYPSYVVSVILSDKKARFRVRVGHYSTREEALQVARRLRVQEGLSFFISKETAPTQ